MPKRPEEYTPSPWGQEGLREDLTYKQVRVPPAMVAALYQLQKDKAEVEYGGAVDFELVRGQPAVERILIYTGAKQRVSMAVWNKVFLNPDVELTFHTHPKQSIAIPSEGDIIFFLTTAASAMLIIAGSQALLLTKGTKTPPWKYALRELHKIEEIAGAITPLFYDLSTAPRVQPEILEDLKSELDIDGVVFPAQQPIDVTVKVVQDVAKEGQRLAFFEWELRRK